MTWASAPIWKAARSVADRERIAAVVTVIVPTARASTSSRTVPAARATRRLTCHPPSAAARSRLRSRDRSASRAAGGSRRSASAAAAAVVTAGATTRTGSMLGTADPADTGDLSWRSWR